MKLIDKDKIAAEIERRKKEWRYGSSIEAKFKREECDDILYFLDTLDVLTLDDIKEMENQAFIHGIEVERNKNIDKEIRL